MRTFIRKITGFLAKRIGRYYFVEVEEVRVPDAIPLRRSRIIVRALTTGSAIQAGYAHCRAAKQQDGKEYALSSIRKI